MLLQRFLLWERRNNTVMPFNETVQQVWARISALRDSLDGPQVQFDPLPAPHLAFHLWPAHTPNSPDTVCKAALSLKDLAL